MAVPCTNEPGSPLIGYDPAAEPMSLLDLPLGYMHCTGMASLSMPGQYSVLGAQPAGMGMLHVPVTFPSLVPLGLDQAQYTIPGNQLGYGATGSSGGAPGTDDARPGEGPRVIPTQPAPPACVHLHYQHLLQMQQAHMQRGLQVHAQVHGQVQAAGTPGTVQSEQTQAGPFGMLQLTEPAAWLQPHLQQEGQSGRSSRSAAAGTLPSAQRTHSSSLSAAAEVPAFDAGLLAGEADANQVAVADAEAEPCARCSSLGMQEDAGATTLPAVIAEPGAGIYAVPRVANRGLEDGQVVATAEEEEELDEGEEEEEEEEEELPKRKRKRGGRSAAAAPPRGGRSRRRAAEDGAGSATSPKSGARTSKFRGVTRHRRSGRFEAHIWVKELGRQLYLGGYEQEAHAAEAYDIAALKSKGRKARTNFGMDKYTDLLACIDRMSMEELVMAVRRQSQGFSRGSSSFRGVTHHPSGRYEARVGIPGSRHAYLGLFAEEGEAARAYDRALVRLRGRGASTNFPLADYKAEMADFHAWQGRVLLGDERFHEIQSRIDQFEKWLKGGLQAFPELAVPPAAADAAAQTAAGPEAQQQQQAAGQQPVQGAQAQQ